MSTTHPKFARSHLAGFTLIEVMIVVAIVAILSMVAYPSYRDYIIRGNIPSATSALAAKQVQMEQFFQDRRTYVGGDDSTAAGIGGLQGCVADSTKYFDLSCAAPDGVPPTATAYRIVAVGKGSMLGFKYTITQTGAKATALVPAGWSYPNPNNCWATKKDGTC